MKKNLLFVAASATLLFAACTSESGGPSSNISYDALKAAEKADVQTPITFGTFIAREAVTRVGTIESPLNLANHYGFGVFAYYTKNSDYSESAKPNFMFNQQVTAVGTGTAPTMNGVTGWEYAPIKYWPNETDSDDGGTTTGISGGRVDKLSFFAYAPYVSNDSIRATDGVILNGIGGTPKTVGMLSITPNDGDTAGDLKIAYKAGTSKYADDLMFGVAKNPTNWTGVDGSIKAIARGATFKDLVKPANNTTIEFYFMHALTRLKMSVVAARNVVDPADNPAKPLYDNTPNAANKTKILIESITINRPIHTAGTLNLNNSVAGEPKWDVTTSAPFVIDATHALDLDLAYTTDRTEFAAREGVVLTKKSVFGKHEILPSTTPKTYFDDYYLLLPETASTAPATTDIIIKYHVMTEDPKLPGGYSDITNTIKKTVPAQLVLEKAKSYEICINIGVNSVDLDVDVQNWTDDVYSPQTVDLPINVDAAP